mmetsp:Transcript_12216/g.26948  ORF Transcript_12216/g.26948 Transcript_12216/m.26948 type:complete len:155 (-) Transcript_12216:900-1364(-)
MGSHYAHQDLFDAANQGHLDSIKNILTQNVEWVHAKDTNWEKNSPLHIASLRGFLEIVRFLVEDGHAHTNDKNNQGNTPLLLASKWRCLDVVKFLVQEGHAKVNNTNAFGSTALHQTAYQEGSLEMVKFLVEEGRADVTATNNDGKTPLVSASK